MEQRIPCGFVRRIALPLLSTKRSPKPLKPPHLPQVKRISRLTEEAMDELDAIQAKKGGGLGQREQWVRYLPTNLFYATPFLNSSWTCCNWFWWTPNVKYASFVSVRSIGCRDAFLQKKRDVAEMVLM